MDLWMLSCTELEFSLQSLEEAEARSLVCIEIRRSHFSTLAASLLATLLPRCVNLIHLRISGCQLSKVKCSLSPSPQPHPHQQHLQLPSSSLSLLCASMCQCASLRSVDLRDNGLCTVAALLPLCSATNLRHLVISHRGSMID